MVPFCMMSPATMKKGTASRGKESSALYIFCARNTGEAAHHHAHEDSGADGNADGHGEDEQDNEGAECGKKNRIHAISFYYSMLDVLRYLIGTAQDGLDTHEAEATGMAIQIIQAGRCMAG